MPVIFITAKTGFIIRNILLGNFITELRNKAKLIIAVQNPDDPLLSQLLSHENVRLVKFIRQEYPPVDRSYHRLRYLQYWMFYIIMANNPTGSLMTYARLQDAPASRSVWLIQRLLYGFGKVVNGVGLRRAFERFYLWFYGRSTNAGEWMQALEKYKPDLVFSTMLSLSLKYTPSDDLPLILAARKKGIKTCTLIQSWDNLSTKPTVLPEWVDEYYTWSNFQAAELYERFPHIDKEKVHAVGSPQFDFHVMDNIMIPREEYVTKLGLDPAKPYILIGTGSPRSLPDEIEKVIKLIRALLEAYAEMQFVIRLHPKDYSNRVDAYKDEWKKLRTVIQHTNAAVHMDQGGFVPPVDFYQDQVNVLRHSELVLNSSSTLTVDAAIVDKPIICLAYDLVFEKEYPQGRSYSYSQSDHYKKLADSGGVWVVRSEEECLRAMKEYLANPDLHKQKRRELAELVTLHPDGKSAHRLAEAVYKLAVS